MSAFLPEAAMFKLHPLSLCGPRIAHFGHLNGQKEIGNE